MKLYSTNVFGLQTWNFRFRLVSNATRRRFDTVGSILQSIPWFWIISFPLPQFRFQNFVNEPHSALFPHVIMASGSGIFQFLSPLRFSHSLMIWIFNWSSFSWTIGSSMLSKFYNLGLWGCNYFSMVLIWGF